MCIKTLKSLAIVSSYSYIYFIIPADCLELLKKKILDSEDSLTVLPPNDTSKPTSNYSAPVKQQG